MRGERTHYRIIAVALVVLTVVLMCEGNIVNGGDGKDADTVAIVNGEKIMRSALADFLIDSFGEEGMDILIRRTLVNQEAQKQGVTLTKDEVDSKLNRLVEAEIEKMQKRYGSDNEDVFAADLERMGYDEGMLREKLRGRLEIDVRPQLLAEKLIRSTITISESDLKDVYAERYREKIQVRQIVLKTNEEAQETLRRVRSGADFETIAKEKSIDRPSAAKGGLIAPVSMRSRLGRAVSELNKGDITDVIQSRGGYHILRIEGVVAPEESKSYEDALPELKRIVAAINLQKRSGPWFLNLTEKAAIKNYLEDMQSR